MAGALGLPELVLIFLVILLLAAAEPLSRSSLPRPITRFIRRAVMRVVRPLAEFDAQGLRAGSIVIFDERTALALIGRAEEEYIAVAGIDQVAPLVGQALRKAVGEAEGRYVCCRVVLTGRTAAHGELFARGQQLAAEVKAQAIAAGPDKLLIEKIKVGTRPMLSSEEIAARGDAVAELQKFFDDAPADPAFLESLRSELDVLMGKLPTELADQDLPAVQYVRAGQIPELIASVAPGVLDRVTRDG